MNTTKIGIIVALSVIIIVVLILLIKNIRGSKLKEEMNDFTIRLNRVKTFPLGDKMGRVEAAARKNEEVALEYNHFIERFKVMKENEDRVQKMLEDLEDSVALHHNSEIPDLKEDIVSELTGLEKELKEIDTFFSSFEEEENLYNDFSLKLKDDFLNLKSYIRENQATLDYVDEGISERIADIENLFTKSEEYIYSGESKKAKEIFHTLEEEIKDFDDTVKNLSGLLTEVNGTIPVLLERAEKEVSLTRQRGINVEKYHIEEKISSIRKQLTEDKKVLLRCKQDNVKEHLEEYSTSLKTILENLENENSAFDNIVNLMIEIGKNNGEATKLLAYISAFYEKQKNKYNMEDIELFIEEAEKKAKDYDHRYASLIKANEDKKTCATDFLMEVSGLYTETEVLIKSLNATKVRISKTDADEQRARTNLKKMQVVVSEMERRVTEYHPPFISSTYFEDLKKSKEYITTIDEMLNEVPIDTDKLLLVVEEGISFVYNFVSDVKNTIGAAMMCENAIVFGNRYRSSYPFIDNGITLAEVFYNRGQYTKATDVAIESIKKLVPNITDNKVLKNGETIEEEEKPESLENNE